ncbi:MAG TPA: hypothetical protein VFH44_08575 [Solirubrobacterales bacterium]|nr:hypothetical protein [Solirubrobacterales bacterium]
MTEPAAGPTELPADIEGGTVLAFLNEVAGGRKLLSRVRDLVDSGAGHIALAAPQNQPEAGQIVDVDAVRDGALSRVEVTQAILDDFGLTASASIFDPSPPLAFDDAVRAFSPAYVLFSSLPEARFGLARKDLIEWARSRTEVPVEHVPVRIEDDAIRWDVTHTLVIATQTVNSPDLVEHLIALHRERPHRYTFISPASGEISREEVCDRLASTMAALYRAEADATGQPMGGSEPFAAVRNAIEHYRVDDILVSTFAGRESKWVAEGLLDRIEALTDDPVTHFEAGSGVARSEPVAVGAGGEGER